MNVCRGSYFPYGKTQGIKLPEQGQASLLPGLRWILVRARHAEEAPKESPSGRAPASSGPSKPWPVLEPSLGLGLLDPTRKSMVFHGDWGSERCGIRKGRLNPKALGVKDERHSVTSVVSDGKSGEIS